MSTEGNLKAPFPKFTVGQHVEAYSRDGLIRQIRQHNGKNEYVFDNSYPSNAWFQEDELTAYEAPIDVEALHNRIAQLDEAKKKALPTIGSLSNELLIKDNRELKDKVAKLEADLAAAQAKNIETPYSVRENEEQRELRFDVVCGSRRVVKSIYKGSEADFLAKTLNQEIAPMIAALEERSLENMQLHEQLEAKQAHIERSARVGINLSQQVTDLKVAIRSVIDSMNSSLGFNEGTSAIGLKRMREVLANALVESASEESRKEEGNEDIELLGQATLAKLRNRRLAEGEYRVGDKVRITPFGRADVQYKRGEYDVISMVKNGWYWIESDENIAWGKKDLEAYTEDELNNHE